MADPTKLDSSRTPPPREGDDDTIRIANGIPPEKSLGGEPATGSDRDPLIGEDIFAQEGREAGGDLRPPRDQGPGTSSAPR